MKMTVYTSRDSHGNVYCREHEHEKPQYEYAVIARTWPGTYPVSAGASLHRSFEVAEAHAERLCGFRRHTEIVPVEADTTSLQFL